MRDHSPLYAERDQNVYSTYEAALKEKDSELGVVRDNILGYMEARELDGPILIIFTDEISGKTEKIEV